MLAESIRRAIGVASNAVWGPWMLALLLGTGVFLTIGLRFVQVVRFREAQRTMVPMRSMSEGSLSPFEAIMTALRGVHRHGQLGVLRAGGLRRHGQGGDHLGEMGTSNSMRWILILSVLLLTHCAASKPVSHSQEEAMASSTSWEALQDDPTCVVPLCEQEKCTLWRCLDIEAEDSPNVVLARATPTVRPPGVARPHRWWGYPLAAPMNADPVFEIPWHNWKTRGQLNRRELHPLCIVPSNEPFEKHHIFPQQERLARWFKTRNIDIHAFTVRLPKTFHAWLHSGGPEGGQWNEAWRQFIAKNRSATQEEIWRFAFDLMNRFGVNGSLIPYYCD